MGSIPLGDVSVFFLIIHLDKPPTIGYTTPMKILFLDDQPQRWHTFCSAMPEEHLSGCDYAESYDEAVALVEKNGVNYYTHFFLDHDLNEEDYDVVVEAGEHPSHIFSGSKNGSMFANWLVENECSADVIVCHSMNPSGRANMRNILLGRVSDKVLDCPFGWQYPERFI